jgi:HK97 family phage prohead protease
MRIKTVGARVKAAGAADGLKDGEFEAIVSVFGNKDSYGDVVMPGAFSDTLSAWKESQNPIPVIWSHDWQDPESHIGTVLDSREVDAGEFGDKSPAGLWVKGVNDIADNQRAARVQRLMAGRRITQFSFAYDIKEAAWETHDGEEVYALRKLDLFEVGPTLVGANQETDLLGAKRTIIDLASRPSKGGAKHSTADFATLSEIHSALRKLGVPCVNDDSKSRQTSTGQDTDRAADGVEVPTLDPAAKALSDLRGLTDYVQLNEF